MRTLFALFPAIIEITKMTQTNLLLKPAMQMWRLFSANRSLFRNGHEENWAVTYHDYLGNLKKEYCTLDL